MKTEKKIKAVKGWAVVSSKRIFKNSMFAPYSLGEALSVFKVRKNAEHWMVTSAHLDHKPKVIEVLITPLRRAK